MVSLEDDGRALTLAELTKLRALILKMGTISEATTFLNRHRGVLAELSPDTIARAAGVVTRTTVAILRAHLEKMGNDGSDRKGGD